MGIIHLIIFLSIGGKMAARLKRSPEGERILIEEAPYFVSIQSTSEHVCGGVLIGDNLILTMPYCLQYDMLTVVSGVDENNPSGTVHEIFRQRAEEFLPWALITLENRIEPDGVQEMANMPLVELSYNEKAHFISFRPDDAQLRRFEVTLAPWHMCATVDYMLCASRKADFGIGVDEIGGPLIVDGRLIGIAAPWDSLDDNYDVYLDFAKQWKSLASPNPRSRPRGNV